MLDLHPFSAVLLCLTILFLPILIFPQLKGRTVTAARGIFQRRRKQPSEIVSLRMYPIKSCRGFEVQQTTLRQHGLDLDRRWMLVDAETRQFLTIRQIPEMTLIRTGLSPDGGELVVTIPDRSTTTTTSNSNNGNKMQESKSQKTIRIPSHPSPTWLATHTSLSAVKIWDTETDGHLYSAEINDAFSAFLGRNVGLVYKGPTPRILKGNGAPRLLGREQSTGFADVHPVLIASEDSLAELNTRLQGAGWNPITVERFRPNIVVRGYGYDGAWREDLWKVVRIQRVSPFKSDSSIKGRLLAMAPLDLDVVARCARCQVPNVDPDTAQKHKEQPWDTLVSYRRVDEGIKYKPCFGMLSAPRNEGVIEVGMRLEVLEETTEHRYITGF